jgi:hypothetical protein
LLKKDWPSAALGAVLSFISAAGRVEILPRRLASRGGASVVWPQVATELLEDLNV